MAEWTSTASQTVNPGESVIFSDNPVPCNRGFVKHRDESGTFYLSGWTPQRNCACGCRASSATYLVDFGANVSIPEGGTVGPISLAFQLEGDTLPSTTMTVTPAAVEQAWNVSRAANVQVFRQCGCATFAVRNTSTQPIVISAANVIFARPDLAITR